MDSRNAWTERPTLSVWIYNSPRGAAAGQVRLSRLAQRGAVTVLDAATVTWVRGAHRPRIGRPSLGPLGHANALSPLGALLGRLTTPGDITALARELRGSGLDERLLGRLRDAVVPDSSALLVLSSTADLEEVQLVIARGVARGDVGLLHVPLPDTGLAVLASLLHHGAAGRVPGPAHS